MVTRDKNRHDRKRGKHDEHGAADHGKPRNVLLPVLAARDGELQCVVSQCVDHSRRVDFGQAQLPTLTD